MKILILKNKIFVCGFKILLNYFETTDQFETIRCFSLLCSFGFLFGTFISLCMGRMQFPNTDIHVYSNFPRALKKNTICTNWQRNLE